MKLARQILEENLQQNVLKIRIDNTFFSQKNYRNVDLNSVSKLMQQKEKFHVEYNIKLFAGMYFHPKLNNNPTILFFHTGSYTIMVGKKLNVLKECEVFVKNLIYIFYKCINGYEVDLSIDIMYSHLIPQTACDE